MPGWAGNNNAEECACGVTETCDGGPEVKCNCDNLDGKERYAVVPYICVIL